MKRSFGMLMLVLLAVLALGIWLLVTGIRTSPYAMPFTTSM